MRKKETQASWGFVMIITFITIGLVITSSLIWSSPYEDEITYGECRLVGGGEIVGTECKYTEQGILLPHKIVFQIILTGLFFGLGYWVYTINRDFEGI